MTFLLTITSYLFIYLVYLLGKFLFCLRLGIYDRHIFLGKGNEPVFTVTLGKLKISLGLFIPLPYLARFYSYTESGKKERIRMAWEYKEVSILRRLIVNYGGAISMLAVAIILFLIVGFTEQETYIGKDQVDKYGIYPDKLGRSYGFQKGDRIVAINGRSYERYIETKSRFLEQDPTIYTVKRDDQEITIEVGQDVLDQLDFGVDFLTISAPFEVTGTAPGSEAERIGLQDGDVITRINENSIQSIEEFGEYLKEYAGDSVKLLVTRNGKKLVKEALVSSEGLLGFTAKSQIDFSNTGKSFGEALHYGVTQPFVITNTNIKAFKRLFFDEPVEQKKLSGLIGIAKIFGEFSWIGYFKTTALFLSIFAFYELFPFPKTAMARTTPLIAERVFNKPFSLRAYQRINNVFWALIFLLFAWSILSDIL